MDQTALPEGTVDPQSIVEQDGVRYFLCKLEDHAKRLGVLGPADDFAGTKTDRGAFGSILDKYGDALRAFLAAHEDGYRAGLEQHFARHLRPFVL